MTLNPRLNLSSVTDMRRSSQKAPTRPAAVERSQRHGEVSKGHLGKGFGGQEPEEDIHGSGFRLLYGDQEVPGSM